MDVRIVTWIKGDMRAAVKITEDMQNPVHDVGAGQSSTGTCQGSTLFFPYIQKNGCRTRVLKGEFSLIQQDSAGPCHGYYCVLIRSETLRQTLRTLPVFCKTFGIYAVQYF